MASLLLGLAAPSPFQADARDLFRDCHASKNGPNGRFYGCPDWNSSITFLPGETETHSRVGALQLTRSAMRSVLEGPLREEGAIKLGDTDITVLVFVPAEQAYPKSFGFAETSAVSFPRRKCACSRASRGRRAGLSEIVAEMLWNISPSTARPTVRKSLHRRRSERPRSGIARSKFQRGVEWRPQTR